MTAQSPLILISETALEMGIKIQIKIASLKTRTGKQMGVYFVIGVADFVLAAQSNQPPA
jgi:hypothetical protein